ncbi:hypothetical protein PHYPSEUDO_004075 [Phytophthora pseudosyringae]|uniref:Uncharacterized protein n=1 Tax=Phytophthora pseudosyringae TaxID=221518 RepID=A0A8T1VP24_9STRA|nr:hypothetical protein PHYPSEUDO_004075 [Phytophthora pseudosyringae]
MHNYLWMIRWLNSCMELSEISRPIIRARLRLHRAGLLSKREYLDEHIERLHQMFADDSIDFETLRAHVVMGRRQEGLYYRIQHLLIVMDIVDMLAYQISHASTLKRCPCTKCVLNCSSDWLTIQPFGMSLEPLFDLQAT